MLCKRDFEAQRVGPVVANPNFPPCLHYLFCIYKAFATQNQDAKILIISPPWTGALCVSIHGNADGEIEREREKKKMMNEKMCFQTAHQVLIFSPE